MKTDILTPLAVEPLEVNPFGNPALKWAARFSTPRLGEISLPFEERAQADACLEYVRQAGVLPLIPPQCPDCGGTGIEERFIIVPKPHSGKHSNILALGYQPQKDGAIVISEVISFNFPRMTDEQKARLSWKLQQFFNHL